MVAVEDQGSVCPITKGMVAGKEQGGVCPINKEMVSGKDQGGVCPITKGMVAGKDQGGVCPITKGIVAGKDQGGVCPINKGIVAGKDQGGVCPITKGMVAGKDQGGVCPIPKGMVAGKDQGGVCPIPKGMVAGKDQGGVCPITKGTVGGKEGGSSNPDLYWKRCHVSPEHANLSTHDRDAVVGMLNDLSKLRSDLFGGACTTGYCSASSGRTYMLKGVDPRVDPAPANERRLKLLMNKIARGIPQYDPMGENKKLGPPFHLPKCIPFTTARRWDTGTFKEVNTPQRNYYIIDPEFVSESVHIRC
ncbi:sperm microtubule inner protein 6 isoform X2 [Pleurodeles waltl]